MIPVRTSICFVVVLFVIASTLVPFPSSEAIDGDVRALKAMGTAAYGSDGGSTGYARLSGPLAGMEFVYIPPGAFTMGSPTTEEGRDEDEKQHRVTLTKGFFMQTTEVTQGQWKEVMGGNPSRFPRCGDDCPVEAVSWNDIQSFIGKLNQREGKDRYRLPTEAEWEYAARAGHTTRFSFGDDSARLRLFAWYRVSSGGKTHAVGSKKPNAWGLYDMHGNVWERCQDWYGAYPEGAATDPTGPPSGTYRVLRGGSWFRVHRSVRSANRYPYSPRVTSNQIGFRLLRTTQ